MFLLHFSEGSDIIVNSTKSFARLLGAAFPHVAVEGLPSSAVRLTMCGGKQGDGFRTVTPLMCFLFLWREKQMTKREKRIGPWHSRLYRTISFLLAAVMVLTLLPVSLMPTTETSTLWVMLSPS